jgi:hypothetical protein
MRRFLPRLADHLPDDRLASLFCDELPLAERLIARRHLARCWRCRVRQEDLEGRRADRMVDLYREAVERAELPLLAEPRVEFARRLKLHIRQTPPARGWSFRLPKLSFPKLPSMNPTLATCMVLSVATALSFFSWWRQRAPDITSNALLVRAERWDAPNLASAPGVVYQEVRITTPKQTMERSIYRDLQGKRQLKQVKLAEREEHLRTTLLEAGVDWDEPISASGYQGWHDHQHERADKIVRAGRHLLRLTTTVPDGSIAEQSLTIRDTDFHPVQRTIAFRDSGTVEIAELDFKILPWTSVDASVFAPVDRILPPATTSPARVLQFPRTPVTATEGEIDEAELGARLILNQLHADTGEQIEVLRKPQGVEVQGLVETEERKRALQAQLRMVPHLTVSIQSVADLKSSPEDNDGAVSIKTASMPNQPSQLQLYLQAQGRSIGDINILAQRLFNAALTISQESKAIGDLQTHFGSGEQRTIVASATLSELIYSHHERLEAALRQERALLAEAQNATATPRGEASAPGAISLMDAADRNLTLSKELTQTNSPATRSAESTLAEMSVMVGDLTAEVHEAYGKSQGNSTLSGKK